MVVVAVVDAVVLIAVVVDNVVVAAENVAIVQV